MTFFNKLNKTGANIAVLYQAVASPVIGGQRKIPRPGGYAESGADIGYTLRGTNKIITPVQTPDAVNHFQWVFPDTDEGIASAISLGADTLWANTVLFKGHPVEKVLDQIKLVGQIPSLVDDFDDKFLTNELLKEKGLPVASSFLVGKEGSRADETLRSDGTIDSETLVADHGMSFPVIVKPIRGRGSLGVTLANNADEMNKAVHDLLDSNKFGDSLIVEQFLDGEEITITVMPPNSLGLDGEVSKKHWALRPIVRDGHRNGVMPFNGEVPVKQNSRAMTEAENAAPEAQTIREVCERAAEIANARGMVRIDCRKDSNGVYQVFDFNMKPNLNGSGRPGREGEESLVSMAAVADGWTYYDLLQSALAAAWSEKGN